MSDEGSVTNRPRVLVVEDSDEVRRAIVRWLRSLPIEIVGTSTCAEATAQAGPFAVGIFDGQLPDGFGDELARRMRDDGRVGEVLFYSGSVDAQVIARLHAVGTVFLKGIDGISGLRDEVARLLRIDPPRTSDNGHRRRWLRLVAKLRALAEECNAEPADPLGLGFSAMATALFAIAGIAKAHHDAKERGLTTVMRASPGDDAVIGTVLSVAVIADAQ